MIKLIRYVYVKMVVINRKMVHV